MSLSLRKMVPLCSAAIALAFGWAFWPLDRAAPRAAGLDSPNISTITVAASSPPVDLDAFRTPLWTSPPPPPSPPAPPPPPAATPPSKLKLLAIVTGIDGVRRGTLYDPDTDRVQSVVPGEQWAGATFDDVAADAVTVTDAAGTRTLRLRPDSPSHGGGGGR